MFLAVVVELAPAAVVALAPRLRVLARILGVPPAVPAVLLVLALVAVVALLAVALVRVAVGLARAAVFAGVYFGPPKTLYKTADDGR